MALNGPKSLESTQTSPDSESLAKAIPESRVDRNDGVFRSTTPSSTSSRARSLNQNENATVSQSPNRGELPEGLSASKGSLEGAAQAIDDAGLLGSDGPIQRSRLANAGGNSSSVLEGSAPQAIAVEDGSEEGNATSGSNLIESRVTDIAGRKAGEGVGPTNNRNAPTDFGSASEGNKSGDSLDVRSSSSGRVARNGEADLMEALAKSSQGELVPALRELVVSRERVWRRVPNRSPIQEPSRFRTPVPTGKGRVTSTISLVRSHRAWLILVNRLGHVRMEHDPKAYFHLPMGPMRMRRRCWWITCAWYGSRGEGCSST